MRIIPSVRHFLLASTLAVALFAAACTGDVGPAGPQGPEGPAGPAGDAAAASAAGISLNQDSYTVGSERTFAVTGWGFKPNESVIVTLHTDAYGPGIVGGVDANDYGSFEVSPGGRFRMDRIRSNPGTYAVIAEGNMGSIASAPIVFVAGE